MTDLFMYKYAKQYSDVSKASSWSYLISDNIYKRITGQMQKKYVIFLYPSYMVIISVKCWILWFILSDTLWFQLHHKRYKSLFEKLYKI